MTNSEDIHLILNPLRCYDLEIVENIPFFCKIETKGVALPAVINFHYPEDSKTNIVVYASLTNTTPSFYRHDFKKSGKPGEMTFTSKASLQLVSDKTEIPIFKEPYLFVSVESS
jgi:hypothetical protein